MKTINSIWMYLVWILIVVLISSVFFASPSIYDEIVMGKVFYFHSIMLIASVFAIVFSILNRKNILPFLFFFCFTSCNDNNNRILDCFKNVDVTDVVKETDVAKITTSNSKTIRIYIEERILKTSDLFDSVEYVQLSNDPNAVIGGINKLIVFDNSFFVHDGKNARA